MKSSFALLLLVGLAGCGKVDQLTAQYTGRPAHVCVAGVTYLQFTTGAALQVDANGKPVPCKETP